MESRCTGEERESRDRKGFGSIAMGAASRLKAVREYRLGEEVANSITHGIGAIAAIPAIVFLCFAAAEDATPLAWASALIYGFSMLFEYTMSTLYHALSHEKAKRVFKVLDHSFIYLFIAGSYTPFCLLTLYDVGGVWLCAFVWAVAALGVAAEAFWVFRPRLLSAALYLLLGWSVVWFVVPLAERLDPAGLALLVAGGLCYSVGCVFYVLKRIPYMHSIFHLLVVAGSALQYFAILWYVF